MKKVLLSVGFALAAAFLLADDSWYSLYDSALNDVKAKKWTLAEEKLKAAMRLEPNQARKVRAYGARFVRYIPEYYLGVVHYNTGKYQQALEEFLHVQNQGLVVEGDAEYTELNSMKNQTMAKMNTTSSPPTTEPAETHEAKPSVFSASDDASQNEIRKKIDVTSSLDALNTAINKGDWDTAQQLVQKIDQLDPGNVELSKLRNVMTKKMDDQKNEIKFQNLIAQANHDLTDKNYAKARKTVQQAQLITVPDQQQATDLLKQIDVAEKKDQQSVVPPPVDLIAELKTAAQKSDWIQVRTLAEQLPETAKLPEVAELGLGILDFYSADYKKSITRLEKITHPSAQASFYLGCSYAALAYLQEHRDELLQKARMQFAVVHRLNPNVNLNKRNISPRIIALYEQSTK
ncbi:MAG: hypothetical protein C5B54_09845 [Acidobacteria bacterium]|nr:MAG: hypothetical protein C5B54_09845 [Acidobacteriota bacterium]